MWRTNDKKHETKVEELENVSKINVSIEICALHKHLYWQLTFVFGSRALVWLLPVISYNGKRFLFVACAVLWLSSSSEWWKCDWCWFDVCVTCGKCSVIHNLWHIIICESFLVISRYAFNDFKIAYLVQSKIFLMSTD